MARLRSELVEAQGTLDDLREQVDQRDASLELLAERIAELELALEDEGWLRLAFDGDRDFSRDGLRKIVRLSRIMYLKNPLIQRAVNVQAFYTWAQGCEIGAKDPTVNEVVQRFVTDPGNKRVFFGARSRLEFDATLAVEGEQYLVLFSNVITGHVRVRRIESDEVEEIICNPQDRSEPWFYRRRWIESQPLVGGGTGPSVERKALYPDWRYRPRARMTRFGDVEVRWDQPVYHLKVGGLAGMKHGIPETYSSLDWARAYKSFLEDWASLVKALSRFAWRVTTKTKKVEQARQKLSSTLGTSAPESNPPATTGAAFVSDDQVNIEPIPKTGATTSAEDGKGLRLMVAAAMNIPDTILSGDVDQGNLATSKTLDRPTELAFRSRQEMFAEMLDDLVGFVVEASVRATSGRLSGTVTVDADGLEQVELAGVEDPTVNVTFPPILEHDVAGTITAITQAAPFLAGLDREVAEMLLVALGADEVDELLDQLEAHREEATQEGVTESFTTTLRHVREALVPVGSNGNH